MLVVFSVGVAALIWDYNGAYRKNVEEITRKTYGKGKKTEELRVEGKRPGIGGNSDRSNRAGLWRTGNQSGIKAGSKENGFVDSGGRM